MIAHYGADKVPMQLRMLAKAVYGVGSIGQNGAGMHKVIRQMKSGGPRNGNVLGMMDISKPMGGGGR
jgi:hypothetical protein